MSAYPPGRADAQDPTISLRERRAEASGQHPVVAATTDPSDWKGTARYSIVRRIGQGAMGIVYEAIDRERNQSVALKTLLRFSPTALYAFKQEYRTLADVQHPNLVRLYELVVTEGEKAFFAMELVRGTDFLAYVQRSGTVISIEGPSDATGVKAVRAAIPPATADSGDRHDTPTIVATTTSPADVDKLRSTLRQLVAGVEALHTAGKLHRDIKPSNILVTPEGRVVILDFGVATEFSRVVDANLSEEHEIVGTARYMAPEQAYDDEPTPASDWYSVGVVLYEALTGRPPFSGAAVDVLSMKSLHDPVPAADCVVGVPSDLDALCRALLQRKPEKRPGGGEILHMLGARQQPSPGAASDLAKNKTLIARQEQLLALRESFELTLAGRATTIRVGGNSGMGKSAVVQHFLNQLVEHGEAVVLRGRAYERESVPFKAIDSAIDALSRYLVHLEDVGEAIALPAEVGSLARLFHVLRRVPSIGATPEVVVADPQLVRRRAFTALRELIGTLTELRPLVLYIDDAQWGDTDSAALLLELMRAPDAPPMLLVMTCRDDEATPSALLREMHERWPGRAEVRDIVVGPLAEEEARRLARSLLGGSDETTQRAARSIARESRGSPFLVEELVRSNQEAVSCETAETMGSITLDQMVAERLERLPDPARRLLEIVAVGGRPLSVPVLVAASGLGEVIDDALALLRERRFVRAGLRDTREVVETSHDRYRESIVAQLSVATLRDRHNRLASAFEATGGDAVDFEAVALHQAGAGQGELAAQYAEQAAEQAATKLAFDHAARLIRWSLDLVAPSAPNARRLRERLGQVLEWAGRAAEAARAYEEASEGAPPLERARLERAAAVELLASGRIDEGAAVLRRALAAVGVEAPRSVTRAIFWLLVYRLRLFVWFLFGLRVKERTPDQVARETCVRIDAVFASAVGFAVTDMVLSTCMAAWSLAMALRAGDTFQILRAAMLESTKHSGVGGPIRPYERALVSLATRLADQSKNPAAKILCRGMLGISLYLRGRWREALAMLDPMTSDRKVYGHQAGWQSNSNVFGCWSLNFLGEYRELALRCRRLIADAEQRGDMYTSVQLRDGSLAIVWLVADEPETARRNAEEAIALWPQDRYLLQHWHLMFGEGEIELYLGNGARAYERVARDAAALKKCHLLEWQHMRAQTAFLRGRCAIASIEGAPALRAERIAEAQRLSRQLDNDRMSWTAPLAAILKAGAANAQGARSKAIGWLREGIGLAHVADMSMYAAAASFQLGSLLGDDEGQGLVRKAEEAMKAQDVRRPDRLASTLVPGSWRSAPRLLSAK